MKISDEKITQFLTLYEEHTDVRLTKEKAYEKGNQLLNMVRALAVTRTPNKYDHEQPDR